MSDIIRFLTFEKNFEIIGSANDKTMKYNSDTDVQEFIELKGDKNEIFNNIYEMFKDKFEKAYSNKKLFITDFKLGVRNNNIPIKWNKDDIKNGYKIENDLKIKFTDCLQQKSVIKIDFISEDKPNVFNEYSINYYFLINDKLDTNPFLKNKDLANEFLLEYHKYLKKNNYFKALKRLYSFYKIIGIENKDLIDFLNSEIGLMYNLKSRLETLLNLMDNNFRPISNTKILSAMKKIAKDLMRFKLENKNNNNSLKESISNVIEEMNNFINKESDKFIKEYTDYIFDLKFYRELLKEYPNFKDELIIRYSKNDKNENIYYFEIPKKQMKLFKKVMKNMKKNVEKKNEN